jgi:hypothetical protein
MREGEGRFWKGGELGVSWVVLKLMCRVEESGKVLDEDSVLCSTPAALAVEVGGRDGDAKVASAVGSFASELWGVREI